MDRIEMDSDIHIAEQKLYKLPYNANSMFMFHNAPALEGARGCIRACMIHLEEVYFPWLDMPSGRSPMTMSEGFTNWESQQKLERDLKKFKEMGIKLDLLLTANYYGRQNLSKYFSNFICSVIERLKDVAGLDIVTTTSLMVARTIKENFPNIDVRASVNMRIGTVKGMEYVSNLFDSFYTQREYNRYFLENKRNQRMGG